MNRVARTTWAWVSRKARIHRGCRRSDESCWSARRCGRAARRAICEAGRGRHRAAPRGRTRRSAETRPAPGAGPVSRRRKSHRKLVAQSGRVLIASNSRQQATALSDRLRHGVRAGQNSGPCGRPSKSEHREGLGGSGCALQRHPREQKGPRVLRATARSDTVRLKNRCANYPRGWCSCPSEDVGGDLVPRERASRAASAVVLRIVECSGPRQSRRGDGRAARWRHGVPGRVSLRDDRTSGKISSGA